mmetsp:Transcript_8862/g.25266  ORF Transcript_8862/g.25266 Transcript_8862/m.25266 type:complete len:520 (-) Transcript_8862:436-1995(-)
MAQETRKGVFSDVDDRVVKMSRKLAFEVQSALMEKGAASLGDKDWLAKDVLEPALRRHLHTVATPGDGFTCPHVRFGRTGLQMPILTCGGMRLQQSWNRGGARGVKTMGDVEEDCQANLVSIIRRSLAHGVNHFETARGYGSSELQYGAALRSLFDSGEVRREDLIVQTKVSPKATVEDFRKVMEESFSTLGLEYVDLLAFHGLNRAFHLDWILGHCMDVVREYQAAGKVRHVGFSTHGQPDVILRAIETDAFDYVNLHYDFVGSYTASGGAPEGGNLPCMRAAHKHDMGVFIISPYDKGGMLYKPSAKFTKLVGPDLDPIAFNSLFLWRHEFPAHTIVLGTARPSDFDEAVAAAKLYDTPRGDRLLEEAQERCVAAAVEAVGQDWWDNWWKGLPSCYDVPDGTFVSHIVWLDLCLHAWGLYDFSKARYNTCLGNRSRWDSSKSFEENDKVVQWGYMPGNAFVEGVDLSASLAQCPAPERVIEAMRRAHSILKKDSDFVVPDDWRAAYDLQPQRPFPER